MSVPSPPAVRKAAAVALIAALAASTPASAQRVRGSVTDSATGEKISGTVVTLTDSAGAFLARSIADADGKFAVLRLVGTARMHVVRIGYRPKDVVVGADSILDVRMQQVASVLATVASSGRRVCPTDGHAGAIDLWEQARAGLLASVVAREANPARIRLRVTERTFEPIRRRTVRDSFDTKDVTVDRSFIAARPAWAFAEQGYMREVRGGDREYFAPDEAVMLDPSFAGTHCLHTIEGKGPRAEEVGIAFEPVREGGRDTLVDVTGVLWLARRGLELRSLEFNYTNLENEAKDAGGHIFFTATPTGVPMIERWVIRTPILAYDEESLPNGVRRRIPFRSERRNVRIVAHRETSGQVGFAVWPDGTRWHADLPRIVGHVDDLSGQPVSGAVVWLRETHDTVRTNADGRFELPYIFPGIYVVQASDSVLAAEGIARTVPQRFGLFNSDEARAILKYYPRADVFSLLCPTNSYKAGTGVLLAKVIDSHGDPAAKAEVDVEVQQLVIAGDTVARPQVRRGETGEDGRFVICGVTRERQVILRAFKGSEAAGVAVDHWREEVVSVTIALKPPQP